MEDVLSFNFIMQEAEGICEGKGGLPKVHLIHKASGAQAEIYLLGAHVTSFSVPDGGSSRRDLLFVSRQSEFARGKAIRGGIPIIFPQFSDIGPLPKHGFARNNMWKLESISSDSSEALLSFEANAETKKIWPHDFRCTYRVRIVVDDARNEVIADDQSTSQSSSASFVPSLETELVVTNTSTSEDPFSFTCALHTYFNIDSIHKAEVVGLKKAGGDDLYFLDNLRARQKFVEDRDVITFEQETDRIYLDTNNYIQIIPKSNSTYSDSDETKTKAKQKEGNSDNSQTKRTITLKKEGFKDAVVWNAWSEKAKTIPDLGDDEWRDYLCIEAAVVGESVHLAPGQTWKAKQRIMAL